MEKFLRKGLEISTQNDGIKKYKPFAIYQGDNGRERIWYVDNYYLTFNIIYFLSLAGYWYSTNKQEAITRLDKCIAKQNKKLQREEDEKIVKTEIIIYD